MLVEDDKSLREIYGIRMVAEGYEIVSAGDGEEALALAVKEHPDLILSDVMMPKISGFDMLDILRATPETKDVKVIMMTALSSEAQRARGEALGANRYLVKSQVGIEDVVRAVKEVIEGNGPAVAVAAPTNAQPIAASPAQPTVPQPITQNQANPVNPVSTVPPMPTTISYEPNAQPSYTQQAPVNNIPPTQPPIQ
jgi:DNA-binding response OmpR family regulator